MKAPDHPVPSGDRTMARLWLGALERAGRQPYVASSFCSRDGAGDAALQASLADAAGAEVARILSAPPPAAWLTYHNYYKAPDLIGPHVAAGFDIPYLIAEGSSAGKRGTGPHARFSALADAANRAADLHLVLNGSDRAGLEAAGCRNLVAVPPFIDTAEWPCKVRWSEEGPVRLATAAMMREGDKLASYQVLASALHGIEESWALHIAGDGPARQEVEGLFAPFGGRVSFHGALDAAQLGAFYRRADLLVWPGVNEAFGMAYIEAAASGCPALAMAYGGVGEVVHDGTGGMIVPAGDVAAYRAALRALLAEPSRLVALGHGAAAHARCRHDISTASAMLADRLDELATGARRKCVS